MGALLRVVGRRNRHDDPVLLDEGVLIAEHSPLVDDSFDGCHGQGCVASDAGGRFQGSARFCEVVDQDESLGGQSSSAWVGLPLPTFDPDCIERAVVPYPLSSGCVGERLALRAIDLALSKAKAAPPHLRGMLYGGWVPDPGRAPRSSSWATTSEDGQRAQEDLRFGDHAVRTRPA